jgi:hypothetical protein
MKQALTILVLVLAVAGTSGQETTQGNDCKPISDPAEYNRKGELKLGRGVDLRLEFGCGKSQIRGSVGSVAPESWPELQAWIMEQIERDHPLGRKLQSRVHDSGPPYLQLGQRAYFVDQYEHGYMQYATTTYFPSGSDSPAPPVVTDFIIFYPNEVTGKIEELERPHPAYETPGSKPNEINMFVELRVSLVTVKSETYIVSEEQADKLKKGEKATFVGYGPLDFWVL